MKRITLVLLFVSFTFLSYAQWTPNGNSMYFNNGNIGIGTSNPLSKLHIFNTGTSDGQAGIILDGAVNTERNILFQDNSVTAWWFGRDNNGDFGLSDGIGFWRPGIGTALVIKDNGRIGIGSTNPQSTLEVNGDIRSLPGVFRVLTGTLPNDIIMSYGYNTTVGDYTSIKVAGLAANTAEIRLVQNGNVGIGTSTPQSKLAVNGTITATRVKVTQSGWPDFVFDRGYDLPALSAVAAFISEHKHLPDIPSAADVEANGIDIGGNQAKLLQKIEELTLYLIDQDREIVSQQETIVRQQKLLTDMEARLKKLEKSTAVL